jgi:hypothetical protein
MPSAKAATSIMTTGPSICSIDSSTSTNTSLDACTTGQFFAEIDVPVATADIIPYEQFLETRFYKEWARPQGLVDAVLCLIDKAVTHMAFWECFGINAMAWSSTKRGDA